MSTFADFALLAAVPSYGGAEILRAQRVLPMGPGPRVHLALFGRNDAVARRVVAAATAGAAILHPAVARIFEVARYDGVIYGVGDPSEGLDLPLLMQTKKAATVELSLAIVATLARVAVSIHDAAGPGYRGPPLGLGSVLSGGLSPESVFLENTGAVRLRPLAAAGVDPDVPTAFRAPEESISMAADVYGLGKLLMALLAGDVTGRGVPRLSPSTPLSPLLAAMTHRKPAERPHLHEAVTRLEGLLREQGLSADVVLRAALTGPLARLVVDPALAMDAPARVIDGVRMQLGFVYPAIERLWPSMMPSMAPPPPPAFAALPPAASDEGAAVFTDARPAVRRQKNKTAATVMFGAADVAAAVSVVSGEGQAFKPKTSPTMIIPAASLQRALPPVGGQLDDDDDRPDKTKLIDPATFTPNAPPPPSLPPAPPVLGSPGAPPGPPPPVMTLSDDDMSPAFAPSSAPPPPPSLARKSDPIGAPPRPPTNSAMAVFSGGSDEGFAAEDDADESTQMLPPEEASGIVERLRQAELRDAAALADAFDAGEVDELGADVFSDEASEPRLLAPQKPQSTSVAPPPVLSEPSGVTENYAAVANAATALADGERHRRDDPTDTGATAIPSSAGGKGVSELSDAFAMAFAGPNPGAAPTAAPPPVLGGDGESDEDPELIDDAADFVMVGDAGNTFEGERNPFQQRTRLYPAQAMQVARSSSDEADDDPDADAGAADLDDADADDGDDDVSDTRGDDADDADDALNAALGIDGDDDDGGDGDVFSSAGVARPNNTLSAEASDDIRTELVPSEAVASAMSEIRRSLAASKGSPSTAPVERAPRPVSELSKDAITSPQLRSDTASAAGRQMNRGREGEAPTEQARAASVPRASGGSETQRVVRPRPVSAIEEASQSSRPRPVSSPPMPPSSPPTAPAATPARASMLDGAPLSQLVVEAPDGATVTLNGTVIGSGHTTVDVASTSRAVVKVVLPGHVPFSTVVNVQGRPRVRVRAQLRPRAP